MEAIQFQGVNLAELLPRIPGEIKNGLPFGLVKLDLQGNVLEYNMAEGTMTGVDPNWALGKNFFDEVAVCTKTQVFYGRFLEGVKKGFLNAVFDYVFDHRDVGVRVKVHMVMIPDHLGRKTVMLLVKRVDKPLIKDATPEWPPRDSADFEGTRPAGMDALAPPAVAMPAVFGQTPAPSVGLAAAAQPSVRDIVEAVMSIINSSGATGTAQQIAQAAVQQLQPPAQTPSHPPPPPPAATPTRATTGKHEDILKF